MSAKAAHGALTSEPYLLHKLVGDIENFMRAIHILGKDLAELIGFIIHDYCIYIGNQDMSGIMTQEGNEKCIMHDHLPTKTQKASSSLIIVNSIPAMKFMP